MDRNFERALKLVLKHEGGWSDHPADPGGATNKGVTLATFRRYVKADATKADLRAITDEQVATVYYRHYWAAVMAHELPAGLDYAVFDFAVNSGPSRAAKYLQAFVGTKQDGRVGPETLKAVAKHDASTLIDALCDKRMAFLKGLKTWPTFKKGWTSRVADVRAQALAWVGRPADVQKVEVEVEKPVVPEKVDKEVKQKTNWLTYIFGAGGIGSGAIAFLRDADWQTIAALMAGGVVAGALSLAAGIWIVRRIKAIKAEIAA
ncbi:glycoside hydrolase family 108 protein [Mesorhizobium sp. J428]|uniref:glycoside hydrolase family 108 protein n=1 Tax=Mesorhizobium sp. J428 TaxID=2898440 RepID=UPI002151F75A|nr:glycoside hydrolase family 108 protein [Mesorhizobium sp. J428]MCR5859735.1 glycoside hydrolase family 108 protein [Mesorhizobium sp. J428]